MIDYLTIVKPLEDQGLDDAAIASHLAARTAFPMAGEESKYILEDEGAVLLDPIVENQRMGSLITYYQGLPDGEPKQLIAWFISRVFSGQKVGTDEYPRSIQFAAVEASLPPELQAVSSRLVEAAGGRTYSTTVEADIAASRQAYADAVAAQEAAQQQAEAEEAARRAEEQAQQEELERRMQEDQDRQNALLSLQAKYTASYNSNIAPLLDSENVDSATWKAALQKMSNDWVVE